MVKRKTGAGKKGSRRSKKQQEALQKVESKAAGTLRLFMQLRFLWLMNRLEKPLRELSRASELDEAQLRAVAQRFKAPIDEFIRESGRPRMIEQNVDDQGGNGGGNGDNGGTSTDPITTDMCLASFGQTISAAGEEYESGKISGYDHLIIELIAYQDYMDCIGQPIGDVFGE
jgi:hypothetical protein